MTDAYKVYRAKRVTKKLEYVTEDVLVLLPEGLDKTDIAKLVEDGAGIVTQTYATRVDPEEYVYSFYPNKRRVDEFSVQVEENPVVANFLRQHYVLYPALDVEQRPEQGTEEEVVVNE